MNFYQSYFEMAYSISDFESNVIEPNMMSILKHFIKYKLVTSQDFSNNFDSNIYLYLNKLNMKEYWKEDILDIIESLMKDIEDASIKKSKSTKERCYISTLNNCMILLSSKHNDVDAIKRAVSNFENKEEVVRKAKKFFIKTPIREFEWMKEGYLFLKSIRPIDNLVQSKYFIKQEYNKFIEEM